MGGALKLEQRQGIA